MGKAIYWCYLIIAIGVGAFALQLLNSHQAVTGKAMECGRLSGAEQTKCMKEVAEMANNNAALAKAIMSGSEEGTEE